MRIFRHYTDLPHEARGSVVALGNFDGVHLGHQAVIRAAGQIAGEAKAPHAVLTFEPHPRSVFRPALPPFRLTPLRAKTHAIEALGVDLLFVQHFDLDFAAKNAGDFVAEVLIKGLAARHVVAGYDFVFGHNRAGDCRLLTRLAAEQGFGFTPVEAVADDAGTPYSSTKIRDFLAAGEPARAAGLLGRAWEMEGRVVCGAGRGGETGFHTANIHFEDYLMPATGVYAVRAGVDHGAQTHWHDGVANLGHRPTFDDQGIVLEVHLFDYSGDLYNRHLRVLLVDYLRPEKKFDAVADLKAQIGADINAARKVLSDSAATSAAPRGKTS